ncbi:hypothetical protein [Geodermatophilus obscurus]|uniref:hypothetical protein n=1 Tax=Geodermatophilus obscurus TaxID=1861 RepID=UPI0009322294|nr:hypothetical protein [Geodermatophilus obscurus]
MDGHPDGPRVGTHLDGQRGCRDQLTGGIVFGHGVVALYGTGRALAAGLGDDLVEQVDRPFGTLVRQDRVERVDPLCVSTGSRSSSTGSLHGAS